MKKDPKAQIQKKLDKRYLKFSAKSVEVLQRRKPTVNILHFFIKDTERASKSNTGGLGILLQYSIR